MKTNGLFYGLTPRRMCGPLSDYLDVATRRVRGAAQNRRELPIDILPQPFQYRGMLGELKNQFSLTRAASRTRGRAGSRFLHLSFAKTCS